MRDKAAAAKAHAGDAALGTREFVLEKAAEAKAAVGDKAAGAKVAVGASSGAAAEWMREKARTVSSSSICCFFCPALGSSALLRAWPARCCSPSVCSVIARPEQHLSVLRERLDRPEEGKHCAAGFGHPVLFPFTTPPPGVGGEGHGDGVGAERLPPRPDQGAPLLLSGCAVVEGSTLEGDSPSKYVSVRCCWVLRHDQQRSSSTLLCAHRLRTRLRARTTPRRLRWTSPRSTRRTPRPRPRTLRWRLLRRRAGRSTARPLRRSRMRERTALCSTSARR